jgi:hypothetical protein
MPPNMVSQDGWRGRRRFRAVAICLAEPVTATINFIPKKMKPIPSHHAYVTAALAAQDVDEQPGDQQQKRVGNDAFDGQDITTKVADVRASMTPIACAVIEPRQRPTRLIVVALNFAGSR